MFLIIEHLRRSAASFLVLTLVLAAALLPGKAIAQVILPCTGRPATCAEMDCLKNRPISCSEYCFGSNSPDSGIENSQCIDDGEGNYDCVCCFAGEKCPDPVLPKPAPSVATIYEAIKE